MNSLRFKYRWINVTVVLGLIVVCSCFKRAPTSDKERYDSIKRAPMSDKERYDSIKVGMSRVEVEKLLGKPTYSNGREVFYGKPPKIEMWESPTAFAAMSVTYSIENVVESKMFYGRTK